MKDWISLFEKYRIDRRLLEMYRSEYACLSENSPRRGIIGTDIARLERVTQDTELLLAHYDARVASPKDALHRADERLFLACHYIKGLTMEETAAEMCVSRDTVYRIRRRILQRGPIPQEILDKAKIIAPSDEDFRDARLRVDDIEAIRAACFASERADASPVRKSPVKERGYPDFIFSAK